jgi:hypothetical protein
MDVFMPKYGTLLFDTEGNGLLPTVTKFHLISLKEFETGEKWVYRKEDVRKGVEMLNDSRRVVAHNGIDYDIRAIKKVLDIEIVSQIRDTLPMARLYYPNQAELDFRLVERGEIPGKLIGSHSLKAWGYRLGLNKGDYAAVKEAEIRATGETNPEIIRNYVWGEWNQDMEDYGIQDVEVLERLYGQMLNEAIATSYPEAPLIVEHRIQEIMSIQESNGIYFFMDRAEKLLNELTPVQQKITAECTSAFPARFRPEGTYYLADARTEFNSIPWESIGSEMENLVFDMLSQGNIKDVVPKIAIPKRTLRFKDPTRPTRTAGSPYTPIYFDTFNPSSRQQVATRLLENGWTPDEFTPTGAPSVNDDTLVRASEIIPIAKPISDLFMINKRLSQLATGDEAWIKAVKPDGMIRHNVNPCGAVTGRATHRGPNLGQVPKVVKKKRVLGDGKKEEYVAWGREGGWGPDCRALFGPKPGWKMVGSDLSGIELRCLSHYMAKFDNGAYAKALLEGDIHTTNQLAAGLKDRDQSKTFIYAFLYGAGDEKIGSIVASTASISEQKKIGAELKTKFLKGLPALNAVLKDVKKQVKSQGYLVGLDGRRLHCRAQHSALNTLLQSAGAIISKYWLLQIDDDMYDAGYQNEWVDWAQMLWVHDETQMAARPEIAEHVAQIAVTAARKAGETLNFNMPVDAEYKIGENWQECH